MKVVALSGGVGGARLVDGLATALPAEDLTVVVNTGDDFEHWGLWISPDLDTVMYTLAGLADETRGWGLVDERWDVLDAMRRLDGEQWFQLGDRDLATHLVRTKALRGGRPLSAVTADLCRALGVGPRVLPMCEAPAPTTLRTADGETLDFQVWLVRERGRPTVAAVQLGGDGRPAPGVLEAIRACDVVIVPPSNPYVSIDPILRLAGVADALRAVPVVAVSPIVGGKAVKGPLAAMIPALADRPPSAAAVAAHYGDLLDGFVCERGDGGGIDVPVLETDTIMRDRPTRARLAEAVLAFAERTR